MSALREVILRYPNLPDFQDLPWHLQLNNWQGNCDRLEELPRGLSRHPVVFINYSGERFALKELSVPVARKEFNLLRRFEELKFQSVEPAAFVIAETDKGEIGVLITRYLEKSLPYRSLFMRSGLVRYREHLLDAIAGLLVQLHLAGVFWGDCSLSNTLFRRDAGALEAYLVDAETAEIYPDRFPTQLRVQELIIMEENVNGDMADLNTAGLLAEGIPISDTGAYIRLRYQKLWEEITREDIINQGENYRIQERIRALNALGFSVGEVELEETETGNQLRLRVMVTDRNFHRDQLKNLTGVVAEERQAQKMMNEIQELKATLSRNQNRSVPLSLAATYFLDHVYTPVINQVQALIDEHTGAAELYCQILEHKWYLSERAQRDVGHQAATEDYLRQFGQE
jgi:hypothetical protein